MCVYYYMCVSGLVEMSTASTMTCDSISDSRQMKRQVKLLLHRDSHLHHLYLGVRIILAEAQVSILPPPPSLYLYLALFLPAGREFRERELTKNCEGLSLKTRNHTLNRESIQTFYEGPPWQRRCGHTFIQRTDSDRHTK